MKHIALLLTLLTLFTSAQYVFNDGIYDSESGSEIKISSPFSAVPPRGYLPIDVEVNNKSDKPSYWTFKVNSVDGYSYRKESNSKMSSEYALECPPREVERRSYLVPVVTVLNYNSYQNNSNVSIEYTESGGFRSENKLETATSKSMPSLLMSEALHRVNGSALSSEYKKSMGRSGGKRMDFDCHFLPSEMPTDWRAYSGFDSIMITPEDWGGMDSVVRRALLDWCVLGGALMVYQGEGALSLEDAGIPKEGAFGWGRVSEETIGRDLKLDTKNFFFEMKFHPIANRDLAENYQSSWSLKKAFGERPFNIWPLIIILLAFAILVGPVNLFVFAKEGRRHRLFFTTPLISIITTLLLFIVILVQDGIGGKGIQRSLVEIDSASNTMYGSQEQICRTGMLLKSQFEMNTPATIDPVLLARDNNWARVKANNEGGKCQYKLQLTSSIKTELSGDWFLSRTESGHLIHYKKPTRQGIDVIKESVGLYALSSLKPEMKTFFYRSADNTYWKASSLKQGIKKKLDQVTAKEFRTWLNNERALFGQTNQKRIRSDNRPNRYYASCEDWDSLSTHPDIKWNDKTALICGDNGEPN